jgi:hypothetical protein
LGVLGFGVALGATTSVEVETDGWDLDAGAVVARQFGAMPAVGWPGVDLAFAYNGRRSAPIVMVTSARVLQARIPGEPFETVDALALAGVELGCGWLDVPFGPQDTFVLRTDAGAWFKVGNARLDVATDRVTFEYSPLDPPPGSWDCPPAEPQKQAALEGVPVRHEAAKLVPHDPSPGYWFGQAVGVHGDRILVGATGDFRPGIYEFVRRGTGWKETFKLLTPAGGGNFGWEISLVGTTTAFGADYGTLHVDRSGLTYIFENRGFRWREGQWLEGSDAEPEDVFGFSTAMTDRWLVVGAPGAHGTDELSGAVWVFERVGRRFVERAKLYGPDGGPLDNFGIDVAVRGDTIVVGAMRHDFGDDQDGRDFGAAYVFEHRAGRWVQTGKLLGSDVVRLDRFGHTVAVDGGTIMVGTPEKDDGATDRGAVYVFEKDDRGEWREQVKLSSGSDDSRNFGLAISLVGDVALISWSTNDFKGMAQVLLRDGRSWRVTETLQASDGMPDDFFGREMDFDGRTAVIAAPLKDRRAGAAYVFDFGPSLRRPPPGVRFGELPPGLEDAREPQQNPGVKQM